MGTSCSPFLANLLLFMYEFQFVTDFMSKKPNMVNGSDAHNVLRKLSFCARYIDDLWNPLIETEAFKRITKAIYPSWLKLGDPEHEGPSVNYLDMAIWYDKTWHSKLYDKRVELVAKGLKLNKFPHPESKLSSRCKYGVITSQLHRFNTACTRPSDFLDAAATLYAAYIKKGYSQKRADKYFDKFRRRHTPHLQQHAVKLRYERAQRLRQE